MVVHCAGYSNCQLADYSRPCGLKIQPSKFESRLGKYLERNLPLQGLVFVGKTFWFCGRRLSSNSPLPPYTNAVQYVCGIWLQQQLPGKKAK
jgi:hypothetical protein